MDSCESLLINASLVLWHERALVVHLTTLSVSPLSLLQLLWFLTSLDAVATFFFFLYGTRHGYFLKRRGRSESVGSRDGVFKDSWPRPSSAHRHTNTSRRRQRASLLSHASRQGRERDRRSPSRRRWRVPSLLERDLSGETRTLIPRGYSVFSPS
jgi:hypothetical protein